MSTPAGPHPEDQEAEEQLAELMADPGVQAVLAAETANDQLRNLFANRYGPRPAGAPPPESGTPEP